METILSHVKERSVTLSSHLIKAHQVSLFGEHVHVAGRLHWRTIDCLTRRINTQFSKTIKHMMDVF